MTGDLDSPPAPPAPYQDLPSPRSDDGNSVTYSEVDESNEDVVRDEIPDNNPYPNPQTEEERFVRDDYGETRSRHVVYSPISDQEQESRGQLEIGPVSQFRPPKPNIDPTLAPAQFEAESWVPGDKAVDSRNHVPSNDDSMWYLRHYGHREDSMIGRGVLNTQSEQDRRYDIRRLRDRLYQSRELHPANEIRMRLLQTREQFIVELVNVRRALVRWVVYLQHRLLHDPDFDALTYLDQNSHPDVVLAQYHEQLTMVCTGLGINLNPSQGGETDEAVLSASKPLIWPTVEVVQPVVADQPVTQVHLFTLALTAVEDQDISLRMSSP